MLWLIVLSFVKWFDAKKSSSDWSVGFVFGIDSPIITPNANHDTQDRIQMNPTAQFLHRPKTKIVCTLGPATSSEAEIRSLIESGMSIARLNLSHGDRQQHAIAADRVRKVANSIGVPVGIMVDVPGIKYRTGVLASGVINIKKNDRLTLTSRDVVGTPELVAVTPPGIHRDVTVGAQLMLDDGFMELRVLGVSDLDVDCEVVRGGRLTERRGVATPGRTPSQSFPDQRAKDALEFAAKQEADFVALSTITTVKNIEVAREILGQHGLKNPYVISKIERPEAVDNFDSILDASDGIMVARGDMGVEVPLSDVPVIQKDIIARCNAKGKPVITATQMLESMIKSPVPTRAEVTDVANAIFDGTDAIMLSGETSIGDYPDEAVAVMVEVATKAEEALPYDRMLVEKRGQTEPHTDDAIAYNACQTAHQLNASVIVAFTESGSTAGRVSKYRPRSRILALTPSERGERRLTLRWGVMPVTIPAITSVDDFFAQCERMAVEVCQLQEDSIVVLVAGLPIGVPGGTNLLRVLSISEQEQF